MGYPEQYRDIELNPPPAGLVLDMDCRGGNHRGCTGPPGTRCDCSCHAVARLPDGWVKPQGWTES